MDKKFYEMPQIEVINLMLEGQILSGSDQNGTSEGDPVETGGGSGEETPGGWG